MTTAKTPNPQSRFRLPDPPPREPDEMTAFDHVYKHGNNRYLAIHLGDQDTTLVVADRWIIAHPDADRSRARRPDLLIAFNVDPRGLPCLQRLHRLRTGQAARLRPRSRLREHRSHRHRRQAPGLRRPGHLRILALRRNRTAPRRSPRRRPACRRPIPTYHHRATARRHPAGLQPCAQPIPALAGRPATLDRPSDAAAHPHLRGPALPRPTGRCPHQRARERSPPPPGTITQSIESDSTAGGVGRPATPKWQSCAQTLPSGSPQLETGTIQGQLNDTTAPNSATPYHPDAFPTVPQTGWTVPSVQRTWRSHPRRKAQKPNNNKTTKCVVSIMPSQQRSIPNTSSLPDPRTPRKVPIRHQRQPWAPPPRWFRKGFGRASRRVILAGAQTRQPPAPSGSVALENAPSVTGKCYRRAISTSWVAMDYCGAISLW